MEHFRSYGLILALLVLSSVICRAEDSICTQAISTMIDKGTMVVTGSNKVGRTDLVTYTCRGSTNAKFWPIGIRTYALMLPSNGDSVVTSRITNLKQVQIQYTDNNGKQPDYLSGITPSMQIKVSEDSLVWTNMTSIATHNGGIATVLLPDPGDYYISVKNTNSSMQIYIRTFEYTIQHCNCYQYHP